MPEILQKIIQVLLDQRAYREIWEITSRLKDEISQNERWIIQSLLQCKGRDFSNAEKYISKAKWNEIDNKLIQECYSLAYITSKFNTYKYKDVVEFVRASYPSPAHTLKQETIQKYVDSLHILNIVDIDYILEYKKRCKDNNCNLDDVYINKLNDRLNKKINHKDMISTMVAFDSLSSLSRLILADCYQIDIKLNQAKEMNKRIAVIFGSNPDKFLLYKQRFSCDVVFLNQKSFDNWYLFLSEEVAYFIRDLAKARGAEKIYLIGASKGGTAALRIGSILSDYFKGEIICTAFSPIVSFEGSCVPFPSWQKLVAFKNYSNIGSLIKNINILEKNLKESATRNKNLDINVIYGKKNKFDTDQALKLKGVATLYPIDVQSHKSMAFCSLKKQLTFGDIEKMLQKEAKVEPDILHQEQDALDINKFKKILEDNMGISESVYSEIIEGWEDRI